MKHLLLITAAVTAGFLTAQGQLVRQPNTTLALPAALPAATGYTTANALGVLTFNNPIAVRAQPGLTNRLLVVERNGTIQLVDLGTMTKSLYFDLANYLNGKGTSLRTDGECGLLSMEFDPHYASNGYIYVFYSFNSPSHLHQRVARFTVNGPPATATTVNPATEKPLITQYDEAVNHNGGDLHVGPDGYLYVSVGDEGGSNNNFDNAGHIMKDFFSAILRLDVDNDGAGRPGSLAPNPHTQVSTEFPSAVNPGSYRVPPDNPFIGATTHRHDTFTPDKVRTEIWATGLRNPFRFSFDGPTGRLFVGDVGQNAYEEIDLLTSGVDSGWAVYEGNHNGPQFDATLPASSFLFPIYEYSHTGGDSNFTGNVVTGGVIYRGSQFTELYQNYIFCDEGSGNIWALAPPASGTGPWTQITKLATNSAIAAFGTDPRNGDVLLVDIGGGQVKHLVRSGTTGMPPPATLSATGAFADLATLTPNAGIVSYAPNVSFWSDYAQKSRWFSIPDVNKKMTFSADGNWTFPTGSVWVKQFNLPNDRSDLNGPSRRIETRFIVKTTSGIYGLSYKWRADQTDADLVAETGTDATYQVLVNGVLTDQTWHYPGRNECVTCHTTVGGYALSFNTRQLNATHVYGSQMPNQIQALSDAGYLTTVVTGVNNLPAFAKSSDTTQSREWRVRSYFAVNCVQCHQPGGAALGNWDARPTTPTDNAQIINGLLNDTYGDPANRFVVPNDTAHSMALKRIQGAGVPRMPPLATNELDPDDLQLLSDWITLDLPQRKSFSDWQTTYFGSPDNPDAAPGADPDGDGRTNLSEFLANTDPTSASSAFAGLESSIRGNGTQIQIQFTQPANRAALIETSTDLANWSLLDVSGNSVSYPPAATTRTIVQPINLETKRFFRLRLSAP